jgi:recombinational DNA repair ATPase RecF
LRERREQERAHLLSLLQKLSAENNRVSALLDQKREKYLTLEARTKQLQTEADILRRWRKEMMESMAGLIQQREQLAEEVLEAVVGSCSNNCWREGIRRTRAFIVLQTLAGLFAGVEHGGGDWVQGSLGGCGYGGPGYVVAWVGICRRGVGD